MKPEIEVLIVGAGPTGLVLALWLSHLGVKVRIVDKAAEPGTTSRALAVHTRILEFYDQIDLARKIVDSGLKMEAVTLWVAGKEKGRIVFGDMGQGISPFPYALIFPQDEHERLLIDRLRGMGVAVELRLGTNLGAVFAPNYARDYARGGGDYAEPQYGRPVLSWFNSGLNGQGRPLAGLGRKVSFPVGRAERDRRRIGGGGSR
jgi:NADPH-dependent 2,4-dienoyl-CoA reductase/sulfur reductase-like enzyme